MNRRNLTRWPPQSQCILLTSCFSVPGTHACPARAIPPLHGIFRAGRGLKAHGCAARRHRDPKTGAGESREQGLRSCPVYTRRIHTGCTNRRIWIPQSCNNRAGRPAGSSMANNMIQDVLRQEEKPRRRCGLPRGLRSAQHTRRPQHLFYKKNTHLVGPSDAPRSGMNDDPDPPG